MLFLYKKSYKNDYDIQMSDYSTFYDSSFDVSGLPDQPSLVRIDRAAIGITETKSIKIGNLTTQVLGTGEVS
jgi:hypothetical protein